MIPKVQQVKCSRVLSPSPINTLESMVSFRHPKTTRIHTTSQQRLLYQITEYGSARNINYPCVRI